MSARVLVYDAAGLTGPLRNMLFSSKPESICDVLIKVTGGHLSHIEQIMSFSWCRFFRRDVALIYMMCIAYCV